MSVDDKSGSLNLIGQFSSDVVGCMTHVKFVNSHCHFDSFDLSIVKSVYSQAAQAPVTISRERDSSSSACMGVLCYNGLNL